MDNEKKQLLKLIGSKITNFGVIVSFLLIATYVIVAGLGQQYESNTSIEHQDLNKEPFKSEITTATETISDELLENTTTEQTEVDTTTDKSSFALLQNNPTLGKSSLQEAENEEMVESQVVQAENESNSNPTGSVEDELEIAANEETSTETELEEPSTNQEEVEPNSIEGSSNTTIENDPALDKTIVTQQEQPSFPYSEKLPIPYEHQEYLYSLCMQYGLEYEKVLAVMEHESKFDPNAIGATSDFGYFQINSINHAWLSETLGTPNAPLDPYVNMQWGTFFLADLYEYWENQGLTGTALEEAVLSSYNKGKTGFRRTGKATNYIEKVRESYALIQNEYM